MMTIFEERVGKLTGRTTPMGVKEILLERRKKEGIEIGLEKGIDIGLEKGIDIGLEKGAHEKALAVALELKKMGIPIADIAKGTSLSIEEIERLN